ncbi:N-terminal acetyltransferase C complex catalytic subunit MAK3, putative [Entamoeba dispar SAW760]|uniref:N-terminal acetyltransferase C complex catalytic subunit MAK3, putative n=1 Tax=Entamoeba dispar (strain ATCC PRA-260 / SAW760) TaxID=370354 RepID=B0EUZ1_ENTDS|nr:N-terminal acetyltransferase C complex catalytic subunit MAK3, putative [Entamoeba dispar SAW760]EDR21652.1 N-terminal acetyltransferase C complex catalytic subunit MAK3, putative [Entamoeba dispar SAW760]|eukprot:EDR21652.1 N-terminal acetyltransferase C complex catalytic subunit MAK3, putative [Entamoeba dispar SAW760]
MSESIEIVPYTGEEQIGYIMDLMKRTLSEPYSIYTYRYFLKSWPHLCFFAKDKTTNKYVGCCIGKQSIQNNLQQGYLAMLSVEDNYRRKGIATLLSMKLFNTMIENKCDRIVLETEADNVSSLALYTKLGFVKEQFLNKYYMNGSDAYQLTLALNPNGVTKQLSLIIDEDK